MLLEYFPLGPATRERLNFLIEADPRAVRHEAGVALEIACQACGGAQLPAEDPERVISLARARAVEDGIVASTHYWIFPTWVTWSNGRSIRAAPST